MSVVSKVIEEDQITSLRDDIHDVIDRLGAVYCGYESLPDTFDKVLEFSIHSVNEEELEAFAESLYVHCKQFLKDEENDGALSSNLAVLCVPDGGKSEFSFYPASEASVHGLVVLPADFDDGKVQALVLELNTYLALQADKYLGGAESIRIQTLEPKKADESVFPDEHLNALSLWLHRAYLLTAIEEDDAFGIQIYPWDLPGKTRETMDQYFLNGARYCNAFRERL